MTWLSDVETLWTSQYLSCEWAEIQKFRNRFGSCNWWNQCQACVLPQSLANLLGTERDRISRMLCDAVVGKRFVFFGCDICLDHGPTSISFIYIYLFIFSNMRFFKWSWYSLTAVVLQNLSTVDLAKEHSWTDVFSESIGFANSWVFQWMSGAQVSHSVAARSMWRLEWPRSWLLVFWFGETTTQLVETSGYFTRMLMTSNIIR